jgi:hypothetical protein
MTPGQFARGLLGPAFRPVGEAYRRIFVDMAKVVAVMDRHIPPQARVLDVGGGDGYVVNLLLQRRPDVQVTMTDLAPSIGGFIEPSNRARVTLMPATDVGAVEGRFDVLTMADVVHHVPKDYRSRFLAVIADTARRTGCKTVIVKDIQPGNFRAALSLFSDLYITGDKSVSLIAAEDLELPGLEREELLVPDFPNYCATFAVPQ